MPRTIVRRNIPDNSHLDDSIHPVLNRIYAARNITHSRDLDYSLQGLFPYQSLHGMEDAVSLLSDALVNRKRILIVADFDADGATSCALAIRGLSRLGAGDLHYIVPNRFEFGYGLTTEIVEVAARLEPELLITVDNGISSIEGVRLAREKGIKVLITDHHLPGPQLPDADAIVNPNRNGDEFPSKNLAGVGVMFYVLAALRAHLRGMSWFSNESIPEPNLADHLDLVALGTIADVVPLDRNNRILVAQGLARIRSGLCVPGIRAILQAAGKDYRKVSAGDLGFALGPRLNAAGRLTDMSLGIECLLGDDEERVMEMATELNALNRERREIQQDMQESADSEMLHLDDADVPAGVCLFNSDWHQGVVGILASRIKEKWHRPVIAFARDRDGLIKGSGRSIEGVHLRDVLEAIASRDPDLLTKFGGHAMAAGLTIREKDFDRFRQLFTAEMNKHLGPDVLEGRLYTDGDLHTDDMNLSLAQAISSGGPWGQGFPEPVFDGLFEVTERRVVGEHHLKMSLKNTNSDHTYDAIAFYTLDNDWPDQITQVQLVYRLDINEFRGRRSLQLIAELVEPVSV